MSIEAKKRQQIIRKLFRIPPDKLDELDTFLSKLESDNKNASGNMSFAGIWQNIDDSAFSDLTNNLIKNRQKNSRRNYEKGSG